MRIELAYGSGTLPLELDSGRVLAILESPVSEAAGNEADRIDAALSRPLGTPPLEEIVSSTERVVILVSDKTRPTGAPVFLPMLLERLKRGGVAEDAVRVLIARGIHGAHRPEETRRILGPRMARTLEVAEHDAYDESALVPLGRTGRGTDVAINRTALEADRLIVTGTVSLHYFAGFGGGRKSILPGISSAPACRQNHILALAPEGGRHPRAAVAVLDGNPVHEDMVEAAKLVEPDFLLNTVLDDHGRIVDARAGHFVEAHEAACKAYLSRFSVEVSEKADLVVASCGGEPKDLNFIQSHKNYENVFHLVGDDGVIVILAACDQGLGHPDFFPWFRYRDAAEHEAALRADYVIYGQTALATRLKAQRKTAILVSRLDGDQVKAMGLIPARDLDEAMVLARERLPRDFSAYVVPSGRHVYFSFGGSEGG